MCQNSGRQTKPTKLQTFWSAQAEDSNLYFRGAMNAKTETEPMLHCLGTRPLINQKFYYLTETL